MSDNATSAAPSGSRQPRGVTREEIRQLLSDNGYSGNDRNDRLKEALTELSQEDGKSADPETSALLSEVRKALRNSQSTETDTRDDLQADDDQS